ncbi:MAG: ABC transporter substrate-binding protein [Acidimicrobiales bacterium]|nr:MAG: ABC transporter substrate-binding protein [Acidimicrobiales bacterium]
MRSRAGFFVALPTVAVLAVACGSSGSTANSGTTTAPSPRGHGNVEVLYAGSLVKLMENGIGPAFNSATGYTLSGFPGGSTELAQDIKGKVRQGDVFVSASPEADKGLMGAANGNWVSWYATFAKAPLLLGYNPKSSFAAQLKTKPWYQVITEPGFRVGRTDPALDPKGKLTVQALQQAASVYRDPALLSILQDTSNIFPEQDLLGRLSAGQLDAGFFYANEATPAHLPTVPLGQVHLAATYTVTVLQGAPNQAGAVAFVKFLLASMGDSILGSTGLSVEKPTVTGDAPAVPAGLHQVVPASS